jgi:hypothetical protein
MAYHMSRGNVAAAMIVAAFPAAFFAEMDALMRAAWLAGAAEASEE